MWRMTWSSQGRARVAIRTMKMNVLHCMKMGQVIIFSTFCMTIIKDQPKVYSSSYYVQWASDRCTHVFWYVSIQPTTDTHMSCSMSAGPNTYMYMPVPCGRLRLKCDGIRAETIFRRNRQVHLHRQRLQFS